MKLTKDYLQRVIKEELESLAEKAMVPMDEILRAEDIIKKHLTQMFDEIGREDMPERFNEESLVEPIIEKYLSARRNVRKPYFDKLTGRMKNK